MALSALELFSIGIGPSSSHTIGPMRAARQVAELLVPDASIERCDQLAVTLYGSLGATGIGHGTDGAVIAGLSGERPETVQPAVVSALLEDARRTGTVALLGHRRVRLQLELRGDAVLPRHPNGMQFVASGHGGVLLRWTGYSVGGGTVVDVAGEPLRRLAHSPLPHPFRTGDELLARCDRHGLSVSDLAWQNELAFRSEDATRAALHRIASEMRSCIERGCATDGVLPGPMAVRRRAPGLRRRLTGDGAMADELHVIDWVSLFAIAVNEENASGGRVVTAPTNGAAGIVPAVLEYYLRFVRGACEDGMERFLLTAGAIGSIYKQTASVSGAEVGCQGEVGSACSMAAAALAEVLGGTPRQVENAAEIGMEHNLGLTCDPVGGRVQVPCIERNALGAVKAITAARIALSGDGTHVVSLDQVIKTMQETGADMSSKYKETSLGGLAVNIVEC